MCPRNIHPIVAMCCYSLLALLCTCTVYTASAHAQSQPGTPNPQYTPNGNPNYQQGVAQESPGRSQLQRPTTLNNQPVNGQPGQANVNPVSMPNAQPEEMHPDLVRILDHWEKVGGQTKNLQGKHDRFTYDFTFNIEKRSHGEFYYETPDRGRLDIEAPEKEIPAGTINQMTRMVNGANIDVKMTVEADKKEAWICDGTMITFVDIDQKQYEKIPIPEQARGKAIEDGPLPFLFGLSAAKAKARYRMELGHLHNLQNGIIHIVAYPKWKQDATNFVQAEIIMDSKTFFPSAIKMVHPGENSWTVYSFHQVNRNQTRNVFKFWKEDPFKPNLAGFKPMNNQPMVQPASNQTSGPSTPQLSANPGMTTTK
jgi:TIGR03009 family protein